MYNTRKFFAILLALLLLLSLAACSNEKTEQNPDDSTVSDNDNLPDEDASSGNEPNDSEDGAADVPNEEDTNESENDGENPAEGTDIDLSAFFDTLSETYEMAATENLDAEMADAFLPGLNDISLRQSVLRTPMITAAVCEILMVECENSEDAAAVAEIFRERMQSQIDGGAWYPASIEVWEGAQIVTEGSFVALFAHSDAESMAQDFSALFTK